MYLNKEKKNIDQLTDSYRVTSLCTLCGVHGFVAAVTTAVVEHYSFTMFTMLFSERARTLTHKRSHTQTEGRARRQFERYSLNLRTRNFIIESKQKQMPNEMKRCEMRDEEVRNEVRFSHLCVCVLCVVLCVLCVK